MHAHSAPRAAWHGSRRRGLQQHGARPPLRRRPHHRPAALPELAHGLDHVGPVGDAVTALIPGGTGVSPVAQVVRGVQEVMGLLDGTRDADALPTGAAVGFAESPVSYVWTAVTDNRAALGNSLGVPLPEWDRILSAIDVDASVFLFAVVSIVPLFRSLKLSPVLGFILAGLLLSQEELFVDNAEVDQLCSLGIQFLLFEMGLELSVTRLKALAKYAFGLGFLQVALVNVLFAAALLPAGDALGTRVLELVQPGHTDLIQIRSTLEAVVISYALSLSSSAFTLQLLSDRKMMGTRFGTATLGVLLFQDVSVVPFIVLLPIMLQLNDGGMSAGLDLPVMVAGGATSLLDLGVLAVGGRWLALRAFKFITEGDYGQDVFVALSLLVVTCFSGGADSIGFSDSLGAFLAGIVLADSPYAPSIIRELETFKSLFLSLFFITVGTTIDVELVKELLPVAIVMATTLIATKVGVVTASGRVLGLTWQEALVAGAFLSQGGEFAFVIFGQVAGGQGSLFPTDLDRLLVVVVVLSMAATPLVADAAFKIAGPGLTYGCEGEDAEACECADAYFTGAELPAATPQAAVPASEGGLADGGEVEAEASVEAAPNGSSSEQR